MDRTWPMANMEGMKKVENERKREEIFCSFFFDDCRDREKNFFSRIVRWRIMEIGMDGFPRRDT